MSYVWSRPVLCIFKERRVRPESEPFVVIRAKSVEVTQVNDTRFVGVIEGFFALMGDLDYLTTSEGRVDVYVVCWFDDAELDMSKDFRRLRGVRFNGEVSFVENKQNGKRTYRATFEATQAKLT